MDRDTAPIIDKPIYYTEDNEILFSAPPKPRAAKQVLCVGHLAPTESTPTITVRLPVGLTPVAFVAYLRESLPRMVVVDDIASMDEGEFMSFQLDTLRAGTRPVSGRLTAKQHDEIEDCRPGLYEFDCRGEW